MQRILAPAIRHLRALAQEIALGLALVAISLVAWGALGARDLEQLNQTTESKARSYASETETRFNRTRDAIDQLAHLGPSHDSTQAAIDTWTQEASFYLETFSGLTQIAWVDASYRVVLSVPSRTEILGQPANRVDWGPFVVTLWAPTYRDTHLDGFVLGVVDVVKFMSPVMDDLGEAYALQLRQERETLLASPEWPPSPRTAPKTRSITLRNAAVWSLSLGPTQRTVSQTLAYSRTMRVFSLFLSLMTTLAFYFARSYRKLSILNALRFRQILESMLEGCQIIGRDWRYRFVNDAAATQYEMQGNVIGDAFSDHIPGHEHSELVARVSACLNTSTPQRMIDHTILADGTERWVDLSIQPAPDGVLILSSDVTERIRAEQALRTLNAELEQRVRDRTARLEAANCKLEAANRELEAFSYSVSHDLRTPLRAISGYAHMLIEDHGPHLDPDARRMCAVITDNAARMADLIASLLSLSRIGRAAIKRSPVDMTALVATVYENLTTPTERGRIDLTIEPLPEAVADPALVRQVWENLISNAIKFTSKVPRGQISISAERDDSDAVVYRIQDNGAGFDMQCADKLFDVFQRLHSVSEFEGTGAGLAIAQRIVHRHGGRIWAHGEPGQGATFCFTMSAGDSPQGA